MAQGKCKDCRWFSVKHMRAEKGGSVSSICIDKPHKVYAEHNCGTNSFEEVMRIKR